MYLSRVLDGTGETARLPGAPSKVIRDPWLLRMAVFDSTDRGSISLLFVEESLLAMIKHPISRRSILKFGAASLGLSVLPSWAKTLDTDVLILGAGISGLHAARILQGAGLRVTVLEATNRIGGRCWTGRDVAGRPEFGAVEVGAGYGRVRGNAAELGVELISPASRKFVTANLNKPAISIQGGGVLTEPWPTSAMNRLADAEKNLLPQQLYGHYISKDMPLADLLDWRKPEFARLDAMSVGQYLTERGASPEALRLMNVDISSWTLNEGSALDFLRKAYYYRWESKGGGSSMVKEGTSALTDAMAASLAQPVSLGKVVSRIQAGEKQVRVTCKDGSSYRARACISTIPLSVMSDIRVEGTVLPLQREAWKAMGYIQLIQVFFKIHKPYWEQDGLSPSVWQDGPLERVFHFPSSTDPAGILAAFINGKGVERFRSMSPQAIGEFALKELIRIRPAMAGAVSVAHVHNWSAHPSYRGHIAYFPPGGVSRYADVLSQPVGALQFAGEHCGKVFVGLEAACESAETAAMRILEELDKA